MYNIKKKRKDKTRTRYTFVTSIIFVCFIHVENIDFVSHAVFEAIVGSVRFDVLSALHFVKQNKEIIHGYICTLLIQSLIGAYTYLSLFF